MIYLGRLLCYIPSIDIFMHKWLILAAWRRIHYLTLIRVIALTKHVETTNSRQRSCTTKLQTAMREEKIRQF